MDNRSLVYDLGNLEPPPPLRPATAPPTSQVVSAESNRLRDGATAGGFDWRGSLSLFLPGSGRLLRGQPALGLFFICSLGFLVTLGWAVLATIDRLSGPSPMPISSWVACLLVACSAALCLWTSRRRARYLPR